MIRTNCMNIDSEVATLTRSLFCHTFINQNVKTKIFSFGYFYFYRLKNSKVTV